MPDFSYTARDATGQDITGSLTAGSHREALALLSSRSLFPTKVEDVKNAAGMQAIKMPWANRVRTDVIASNLTQLGDLLQNGVPLLSSLKILAEQGASPKMCEVMQDIHDQVAEGKALEEAMAQHSRVFSELTISMVRAGAEGGFLEDSLRRVAGFLEHQEQLKGRVTAAMFYPMILAVFGVIVTAIMVVFFVPKFEGIFTRLENSGAGLPASTTILLFISETIRGYWIFLMIGGAAAVWGLSQLTQTAAARDGMDRWKLKLPVAGKIFHSTALARFCRVLGTLLQNGVPILRSLEISSASTGNRQLSSAILGAVENVSAGETLSQPLAACGLVSPEVMAMIGVAEESDTLDHVLINVADRMDQKVERQLDMMVRLVEPVMLMLIGGMVFFILVALLLPIFEMGSTLD